MAEHEDAAPGVEVAEPVPEQSAHHVQQPEEPAPGVQEHHHHHHADPQLEHDYPGSDAAAAQQYGSEQDRQSQQVMLESAQAQAAAIAAKYADDGNKRKFSDGHAEEEPDYKRMHADVGAPGVTAVYSGVAVTGDTTFTLHAPADKIGRIIGRAGVTIRELEQRTGCRVQVDHKSGGDLKPVHISGPAHQVEMCKAQVMQLLEGEYPAAVGSAGGVDSSTRSLECPPGIVGRIIGRGGETIRSLQAASGAHILVDQNFPPDVNRVVTISGRSDAVERATTMVSELISGDPGSAQQVIQKVLGTTGAGTVRVMECAKSLVGRIIGKGGDTIKSLQKQFGTSIQIDQSVNPCRVTIAGPPQSCVACEQAVTDVMEDRPPTIPGYAGYGVAAGAYAAGGYAPQQFAAAAGYAAGYGMPAFAGGYPGYGMPAAGMAANPAAAYGGMQAGYGAPAQQPFVGGYGAAGGYPAAGAADAYGGYNPQAGMQQQQQMQQQQPMPPQQQQPMWQELRDDQNRTYYYNSITGVSQWERPADMR